MFVTNSRNLIKTSQVPLRPPINILTAPEKARGDSHSESLYSAVQPTSSRFSHSLSLSLSFTFFCFILTLKQVFLPLFFSNPGIYVPQAFVTYMSLEFNSEMTPPHPNSSKNILTRVFFAWPGMDHVVSIPELIIMDTKNINDL